MELPTTPKAEMGSAAIAITKPLALVAEDHANRQPHSTSYELGLGLADSVWQERFNHRYSKGSDSSALSRE